MAKTRRVFVSGDIANASKIKIYDADTDTEILCSEFFYRACNTPPFITASILEVNSSQHERVEIVSCPRALKPGDEVFQFSMEQVAGGGPYPTEDFVATARCFEVEPGGSLRPSRLKTGYNRFALDASLIRGAADPEHMLKHGAEGCMHRLADFITCEFLKSWFAKGGLDPILQRYTARKPLAVPHPHAIPYKAPRPSPMAGAVPPGPTPLHPFAPTARPVCPECWGTGYWKGSGKPCSKGCKP